MRRLKTRSAANPGQVDAQKATPYATALRRVSRKIRIRVQPPGHGGRLPWSFLPFGGWLARLDVSVIRGLDVSLNGQPTPLVLSERLAAEAVGAQACSFFTNGASAAAAAFTSALVDVAGGRRIVVARNAHASVINSLFERGALVEFLPVEVHPLLGMATVLDPALLAEVLAEGDVGGVLLSMPSYEGVLGAMAECIALAKAAGVPIVIDGSWASEMVYSDRLGTSPLTLGADGLITSPHKTLRTLGQAAQAFLGRDSLIPLDVFETAMLRHKTTSKSSIFLAMLDLSRRWSFFNADRGIQRNLDAVAKYSRRYLPEGVLVDWDEERDAGRTIAPRSIGYRMTIATWKLGYTGYELEELLRTRYGVQSVLANFMYLFVGTGVDDPRTIKRVLKALGKLLETLPKRDALDPDRLPRLKLTRATVDFSLARGETEIVTLEEAIGRRLADPIGAYPPGIALLVAGEVLDEHTAEYLQAVLKNGGTLYGGSPRLLAEGKIRVFKES